MFYTKAFLNAGPFLHFSNASSIWASSSNDILGNSRITLEPFAVGETGAIWDKFLKKFSS